MKMVVGHCHPGETLRGSGRSGKMSLCEWSHHAHATARRVSMSLFLLPSDGENVGHILMLSRGPGKKKQLDNALTRA